MYNAPFELAGVIIRVPFLVRTIGYVRSRVVAGILNVRPNYVSAGFENRPKYLHTHLTT